MKTMSLLTTSDEWELIKNNTEQIQLYSEASDEILIKLEELSKGFKDKAKTIDKVWEKVNKELVDNEDGIPFLTKENVKKTIDYLDKEILRRIDNRSFDFTTGVQPIINSKLRYEAIYENILKDEK